VAADANGVPNVLSVSHNLRIMHGLGDATNGASVP
jgi:hypothetical protein